MPPKARLADSLGTRACQLVRAPLQTVLLSLCVAAAIGQAATAVSARPLTDPAPAGAVPETLVAAVIGWAAADMGLPVPVELPRLVFIDPSRMLNELAAQRREFEAGSDRPTGTPQVVAFYNTRTRTLYLPAGWTGDSPVELSILVHELVHHLQDVHGQRFACPAEREEQAYATQARWLEMFGEDLESAFGINSLALLVRTRCMF